MARGRDFIANQIFVGLPWKTARPKYERIISELEKVFPVYLTIFGRDDGSDAVELFDLIKERIRSSSYAIFDVSGGNANVSLEFGYAEGVGVDKAIFLNVHGASKKSSNDRPIISDLGGRRRIQYTTEKSLRTQLEKICQDHPYTIRFESALKKVLARKRGKAAQRQRQLAVHIIRQLDLKELIRRDELVQNIQAQDFREDEIDTMLRKLHGTGIINCSRGRSSKVKIT